MESVPSLFLLGLPLLAWRVLGEGAGKDLFQLVFRKLALSFRLTHVCKWAPPLGGPYVVSWGSCWIPPSWSSFGTADAFLILAVVWGSFTGLRPLITSSFLLLGPLGTCRSYWTQDPRWPDFCLFSLPSGPHMPFGTPGYFRSVQTQQHSLIPPPAVCQNPQPSRLVAFKYFYCNPQ